MTLTERTNHLDLSSPCQGGGPLTTKQLSRALDVEVSEGMTLVAVCGNTECSNPLHHCFVKPGETRKLLEAAKTQRVKDLLLGDDADASVSALALKARVSRTLVRRVIAELDIDRSKVVGADGRTYKATYR